MAAVVLGTQKRATTSAIMVTTIMIKLSETMLANDDEVLWLPVVVWRGVVVEELVWF